MKRPCLSVLILTLLSIHTLWSCSSNQEDPEEPVAADEEMGVYPGDSDMESPPPYSDDGGAEELPGELGDEPFSPTTDSIETGDSAQDDMFSSPETEEMYSNSFDSEPEYQPWDGSGTQNGTGEVSEPNTISSPGAVGGNQVVRYVDALLLNVRGGPSFRAPIVRRLLGGAKILVEIEGKFARIKPGQYVSVKYLSATPTRKVSRTEVVRAWQRSKYKDTWVPPGQR